MQNGIIKNTFHIKNHKVWFDAYFMIFYIALKKYKKSPIKYVRNIASLTQISRK